MGISHLCYYLPSRRRFRKASWWDGQDSIASKQAQTHRHVAPPTVLSVLTMNMNMQCSVLVNLVQLPVFTVVIRNQGCKKNKGYGYFYYIWTDRLYSTEWHEDRYKWAAAQPEQKLSRQITEGTGSLHDDYCFLKSITSQQLTLRVVLCCFSVKQELVRSIQKNTLHGVMLSQTKNGPHAWQQLQVLHDSFHAFWIICIIVAKL